MLEPLLKKGEFEVHSQRKNFFLISNNNVDKINKQD